MVKLEILKFTFQFMDSRLEFFVVFLEDLDLILVFLNHLELLVNTDLLFFVFNVSHDLLFI